MVNTMMTEQAKYKPRLYLRHGIWCCRGMLRMGHGYTPAGAYAEWASMFRMAGH